MMDETFNEMSNDRIIAVLKELKSRYSGTYPSKFYFSLGYAIRLFEKEMKKEQHETKRPLYRDCKL